ncbi:MAG: argininosuccinate synthase [Dehalococcoidia bacterium]
MPDSVVLAYSGGLDTSVAIRWIPEKYGLDVIALTIDLGNEKDIEPIRERALKIGAKQAIVVDAREDFVRACVWPALQANALYEGKYPLATALARPLIAKLLVDTARQEGATAVAHGCTGKGNDQVRFDISISTLAPDLRIIAPVREWTWNRDDEIAYAEQQGLDLGAFVKSSPYSIDVNLWGRSIESGVLEDPWTEPPEDAFAWTRPIDETPLKPAFVEIEFDQGIPVALDGERLDGVELIARLNRLAGEHGIGRIDHIENRFVGIKSREVYEAPAATVLLEAHRDLEQLTLSKEQQRFKQHVTREFADLVYNGFWFTMHHADLMAYVQSSQRMVSGTVRMRLSRGACAVVGRKSPNSLFSESLATYGRGDQFNHAAALGFIDIAGMAARVQAIKQLLPNAESLRAIMPPKAGE